MNLLKSAEPIPLHADSGGTVRVGNTRVSLDSVVHDYKSGATAEQIAFDFPTLELADIHTVIAYYLRHREEVEQYLRRQQREATEVREQIKPIVANGSIRERLVARRRAEKGNDAASND